jgi:hypothetical protein
MGSYVTLRGGVPVLKGMSIAPYAVITDDIVRDDILALSKKDVNQTKFW